MGAVAANFLGMAGLSCVVLEREVGEHGQPRAFSCDDEALRIYQQIGLVDRLLADMVTADQVDYTGVAGRQFAQIRFARVDFGSGYSPLHFFHQPTLEATLRAGMGRFPTVSLRLGCAVTGLRADAEAVTLSLRGATGPATLTARYVLGCDGARSTIRRLLGVSMHGARCDEPWLAISGVAEPGRCAWPTPASCATRRGRPSSASGRPAGSASRAGSSAAKIRQRSSGPRRCARSWPRSSTPIAIASPAR
ncbi:FAD-dependent monooxygenase [Nannocystis pusilla]|uniref:FAD-dependent monooxygenase n=1 Tax=Nannocystis pusilla TaxID=889268 RepID=UPI003B7DC187